MHTVIVVDADGGPIRVVCGFCRREHNYRGGPRPDVPRSSKMPAASSDPRRATSSRAPFPIVSERERTFPMSEAEKKAAALPPKLTVPMILFFLPVLFAVIITPAIIQITNLR